MQTVTQPELTIVEEHSEDLAEFAKALCDLQGELDNVEKGKDNLFFKSKYADLSACLEASRQPMKAAGFSHCQLPSFDGQMVHVTTMLLHTSGQWMKSRLSLKPVKQDPQSVGSAITYARRYSFCAMIGLTQKDDDGGKPEEFINDAQVADIKRALKDIGMSEVEFLGKVRLSSVDRIPVDKWDQLAQWLVEKGADFEDPTTGA